MEFTDFGSRKTTDTEGSGRTVKGLNIKAFNFFKYADFEDE